MFPASILVHLHNNPFVIWRTWMSKLGPNLALWQFFGKNGHPKLWFWGVFWACNIVYVSSQLPFCHGLPIPKPPSLYSNCLSGAKASDIKLWLSLARLKKWSPWILIGNQMLSWSTMHQCIIAYSHFFTWWNCFTPKFAFVWTLCMWEFFICID